MDAILLIESEQGALKALKTHLIRAGFRVTLVGLSELDRLDSKLGKERFVLGVLEAAESGGLQRFVDRVRSYLKDKELKLVSMISPKELGELGQTVGLEDFCLEPFSLEGVEARIRFLLRRFNQIGPDAGIRIGALEIYPDRYEILLDKEPLELTYKEFELFRFLATHPSRVFNRDQLLNQVWGYDFFGGTRTVDVHIRRLRAKLGPKYASLIATVRNVGYKFTESL